jgi:hypothetical protein
MTQSRIDLLKQVKSAVNAASFAPNESRISEAKAAIEALSNYVATLQATSPDKPKASKPQRKTREPKATPDAMLEASAQRQSRGIATTYLPKEEPKPKIRVQSTIATPNQDLSDYASIEDAIRDIRSMKLKAAQMQAELEDQMELFDIDPIEDCITSDDIL